MAVGEPDGSRLLTAEARGPEAEPEQLGVAVAEDLLRQGARRFSRRCTGRPTASESGAADALEEDNRLAAACSNWA